MTSSRIKIMFFIPSLSRGGAEKHFARLIQNLNTDRFEKILVTSRSENQYIDIINQDEIKVISLNINNKSSLKALLFSIKPLIKVVNSEKPKIFVSVMDMVNLIAWIVRKFSSTSFKSIYLVQASLLQAIKFESNFLKKILYHVMPRIYSKADKVIVLSNGVREEILEVIGRDQENIVTIHNIGVTKSVNIGTEETKQHRKPYSIICCGRLVKLKGFDLVIKALPNVLKIYPEVSLTFLGAGPEEKELKDISRQLDLDNHVHFTGMVTNPEEYFSQSEVFVLSSYLEGFGNVIIEAMASGCAIIATDCPHGPSEIVEHGKNGILVKLGDVDGITNAIIKLFADQSMLASIAENGYNRAFDFTPEKISSQYEKALLSVIFTD